MSNDELKAALDHESGEMAGVPRLHGKDRDATAARVDAMLATVLATDVPHPARIVMVRQRDLEASLGDAAGDGLRLVDLRGKHGIRDRHGGPDRRGPRSDAARRKVWTDAPAEIDAAA